MREIKQTILLSFLLAASVSIARASFESPSAGARPLGMAEAFTGLADDVNAVSFNPAGLDYHLQRAEFAADYGRLWGGLDDKSDLSSGFLAIAKPLRGKRPLEARVRAIHRLSPFDRGIEASAPTAADRPRSFGTLALAFSNLTLAGAVAENTMALAYAKRLHRRFSAGAAFKLLREVYTQDAFTQPDPAFRAGNRILRFSLDAGLLYNLFPRVFWGLSAADVNRPDVALNPLDKQGLDPAFKTGIAFRDKKTRAAVDGAVRGETYRIQAGAERWFKNGAYALRAGGGMGSREYKSTAFGMSASLKNVQIDYAFIYPLSGVIETQGSHKFSFVFRFGAAPVEELEAGSLELYYEKLKAESEMLRGRLKKSEEERIRLEKALIEEAVAEPKPVPEAPKPPEPKPEPPKPEPPKVEAPKVEAPKPEVKKPEPKKEEPPKPKTYTVGPDDTLISISEKVYGAPDRWKEIYNANKDKVERGSLTPGEILTIP